MGVESALDRKMELVMTVCERRHLSMESCYHQRGRDQLATVIWDLDL